MIENKEKQSVSAPSSARKRRFLSPEKKYQIFLETQGGKTPVGEILRREGLYSTDLVRIREKVKEGALERLADRPGARCKTVPLSAYETLTGLSPIRFSNRCNML